MSEELLKDKETQKQRLEPPKMYNVVLHNDDFTPMEFVVDILHGVFRLSEVEAERVAFEIHQKGVGVAGTYTKDIAETKASNVQLKARNSGYPLLIVARCIE